MSWTGRVLDVGGVYVRLRSLRPRENRRYSSKLNRDLEVLQSLNVRRFALHFEDRTTCTGIRTIRTLSWWRFHGCSPRQVGFDFRLSKGQLLWKSSFRGEIGRNISNGILATCSKFSLHWFTGSLHKVAMYSPFWVTYVSLRTSFYLPCEQSSSLAWFICISEYINRWP